jgi:hypothetical protein
VQLSPTVLSLTAILVSFNALLVSWLAYRSGGVRVDVDANLELKGVLELDEPWRLRLSVRAHNRRRAKAWVHEMRLHLPRGEYFQPLDLPFDKAPIEGQDAELFEFQLGPVMDARRYFMGELRSAAAERRLNRRHRRVEVRVLINGRDWRTAQLSLEETERLVRIYLKPQRRARVPENGEVRKIYVPGAGEQTVVYSAAAGRWIEADE